MTKNDVIGTWRFHSALTLQLLDWVPEDGLMVTGEVGGRAVAVQFAHIHTARRMWLETAAPELLEGVEKIPTRSREDKAALSKERLHRQLTISADAIETLLERSLASGSVKNFKGSAVRFLGYLIAHESYHWAEIGIILNEAGLALDKGKQHQLWQWW
jgi:uncharacterized damage-inducible protein DinB